VSSVTAGTAEPDEHNTILEKESTCPIPTCRKRKKNLNITAGITISRLFSKIKVDDTLESDPEFQKLRVKALAMLASWICRRKATAFDLVRFINNSPDFIPTNCSMMTRCQEQMGNLTRAMNWFPPRDGVYTMYPVNHPSVLIQLSILITLLSMVTYEQRAVSEIWMRLCAPA